MMKRGFFRGELQESVEVCSRREVDGSFPEAGGESS